MNITLQDAILSLEYIKKVTKIEYEEGKIDIAKFARLYSFYNDTQGFLEKMIDDLESAMKDLRGENYEIS